jgi:CelD/BcsL family acetyltransferase involved in cellulose biosynthesis/dTDP-4-amino-4,6-dideoxygalactose transaminase
MLAQVPPEPTDRRAARGRARRRRGPRVSAWPPLPPAAWVLPPRPDLPFPLGEPRCRLFARGRHALWHGLHALALPAGAAVLVPAYHHGSEIEVLVRLGLECRFYELTVRLEPDEAHLDALLDSRVRALHLIHYLGWPQDAARWRRWCDERRLALIEDAAMAWLAHGPDGPVGSHGDVAIFCLYKSFGLPDGAALIAHRPPDAPPEDGPPQLRGVAERHLAWLLQRAAVAPLPRNPRIADYDAASDFALGDPDAPMGAATRRLLPRIADPAAAGRRRANARVLLEELREHAMAPFDHVPDGAAPFAFPVWAPDKRATLARLARRGVEALDVWSTPHPALPAERFPAAATRRASTVALPVHQELAPRDLERSVAAAAGAPSRRPSLRLVAVAGLDEVRETWQALARRSRNVFATWEWADTWWRHFGACRQLRVSVCRRSSSEAVAVLPLCSARERSLRTLRFIGYGPADQLGPVCAPKDAPAVARALRRELASRMSPWDLFVADHLPADEGWGALLGARFAAREPSPVVDIQTTDWDAFLAARSASLRKQIRYQERRLEREHALSYRLAAEPARIDDDFELLRSLHERRWAAGVSDAFAGPRRAFLRDFVRCALERGWLRLWFLELDGRAVAGWLGFRYCGVESYYQGGRDPAWDRRSVGAVLVAHTLRAAIRDGMTEYRFLRGGEAYKDRLATRDAGVETLVLAGTSAGRAALASARTRRAAAIARHALARASR